MIKLSALLPTMLASDTTPGVMSPADKLKLDGLPAKRRETYSGVTNASGLLTVTFAQAFAVPPNVQANLIGNTTEQQCRIVSVSTTGCVIAAFQRVAVLTVALSTATTPVSGAAVDLVVTEK